MSEAVAWRIIDVDPNPDGTTAIVSLIEKVIGTNTPVPTDLGECKWADEKSIQISGRTLLRARNYPLDRLLTEAEIEQLSRDLLG